MPAPNFQFPLRVEAATDDPFGPEAVEEFALDLRQELSDLDVTRIDRVPGAPAPEGTRALEALAVLEFLVTAVQAGEALGKIVRALRRVAERYAQRRRAVRLVIAGTEVDLAAASPGELERVVQNLLARPATTRVGTRSALIIANAHYDDSALAQLRSPGHDAEALVRVLNDPAIGGFQAEALVDADERTIRRRVATFFADRDRDDVLLLHFSCHGVKDARGRLHLAARDTDLSVLGATSIPASFINDQLAETQSRSVVLVLDCCYSGAFARGVGVRAEDSVHIADEFGAGSGRIVLTASSATEYSFEDGELTRSQGRPSAFTGALVRGLESGEADLDSDGEISIDELYDYTYRVVRDSTPGQAPMKWSFGVEGSLVVARSVRPAALPAAILDDLASDRVVLRLEGVRGLAGMVRDGRPGQRAAARARLESVRDNDDSARVRTAAADALGEVPVETVAPPPEPAPQPAPPPEPAPRPAPPPRVEPEPDPEPEPEPEAWQAPPVPVTLAPPTVRPSALRFVVAALLLVSALSYGSGIFQDISAVNVVNVLLTVVLYVGMGLLLIPRAGPGPIGVAAGLTAWELLIAPLLWQHDLINNGPNTLWVTLVVGNLAGIAALVFATVEALRMGRPDPVSLRRRAVYAVVVAVFAVPLSLDMIELWYAVNDFVIYGEGAGQRLATALGCAAVVVLLPLAVPGAPIRAGWLIGGAVTLAQSWLLYAGGAHYHALGAIIDTVLLAVLVVVHYVVTGRVNRG